MSTSWSLCCTDCGVYSDSQDNGKAMFQEVFRAWPQIKALIDLPNLWYVDVSVGGTSGSDLFPFFEEHAGHTLVLEDEYGRNESILKGE